MVLVIYVLRNWKPTHLYQTRDLASPGLTLHMETIGIYTSPWTPCAEIYSGITSAGCILGLRYETLGRWWTLTYRYPRQVADSWSLKGFEVSNCPSRSPVSKTVLFRSGYVHGQCQTTCKRCIMMYSHVFWCLYVCVYIYIWYTYTCIYSLFVCMVWLYMYIYIFIKPKLCSKKQCTHSCLARAVKCWSSAVPAHRLTQANPTNHLYLEYGDLMVIYSVNGDL